MDEGKAYEIGRANEKENAIMHKHAMFCVESVVDFYSFAYYVLESHK